MSFPLLITKLHIPHPQPRLIARPRLLERINAGMERKLTLISAPAGFGKTALVEQWADTCGRKVCWLSLDENDNDPTRYWGYILASIQTTQAGIGENTRSILQSLGQSLQPFPSESLITTLLNDINAFSDEIVLILDDYHLIENLAIQEGMIFFIDHLPINMHILLLSRMDPPFPLARLRARSQVVELRADDLRFILEETSSFLNQAMTLNISPGDIASLETRTEGWIAGLQLAALSLKGHTDPAGFIASFSGSHRFILDYLAEEVLLRQPEDIQTFLLETSILNRFTASLCDAVTGRESGQATLERLERSNLFIIPLDNERRWFRYHHLFADLLRSLMRKEYPGRIPQLHRDASDWFEQNGWIHEAIDHSLAARDFERAAHLMDLLAEELMQRGEWQTLMKWGDALPESLIRARPRLFLYRTWVKYLSGQNSPTETDAQLNEIESSLSEGAIPITGEDGKTVSASSIPPDRNALLGMVAAARAELLIFTRDPQQSIASASRALQLLPVEETYWRSFADGCLVGAYMMRGEVRPALQALADAISISQSAGKHYSHLFQHWREARLHAVQGNLKQAVSGYRDVVNQAESQSLGELTIAGYTEIFLGDILREWNDLEGAADHIEQGIALLRQMRRPLMALRGYAALARLKTAEQDYAGALEALAAFESLAGPNNRPEWLLSRLSAYVARVLLMKGNLAAAVQWAETSGLVAHDKPEYGQETDYLILIRVLIARARAEPGKSFAQEALYLLKQLLDIAETQERTGSVIEILTLQALAFEAQRDSTSAMAALKRALSLAMPGEYIRIFVDEGDPMRLLILEYRMEMMQDRPKPGPKMPPERVYIDRILSAFPHPALPPPPVRTAPSSENNSLIEPLSHREIEVLRLIASGRSTEQIASELYITVGTVRNHLKSIYGKLDAHNRVQAVEHAREHFLL